MTLNEQIKTFDNKIRLNQAQYDLDRQNANISALYSGELDKYEYLTGEDLDINQMQFKKQSLNILLLVRCLIKS